MFSNVVIIDIAVSVLFKIYKAPSSWTKNQYERSQIIFKEYPDIKTAFNLVQNLRNIFNSAKSIEIAYPKLAHWYKEVEQSGFRAFNTIANTISINFRSILNYFVNRSTNASAEFFNANLPANRQELKYSEVNLEGSKM